MSERIRVAVAGLGYWGPTLARKFDALPEAELIVRVLETLQRSLDEADSTGPATTVGARI